MSAPASSAAGAVARRYRAPLLDPSHQVGLVSLLSKIYKKPVELRITKLRKPHLDADILSSYVTQRLGDRSLQVRRVMRDAAWKAQLPSDRTITELRQAKIRPGKVVSSTEVEHASAFSAARAKSEAIIKGLKLSQVSSIRVEAAGRLSKRMTANRAQRKIARRGATTKGSGYVARGNRKLHVVVANKSGKRRIGAYGVRVDVGHS